MQLITFLKFIKTIIILSNILIVLFISYARKNPNIYVPHQQITDSVDKPAAILGNSWNEFSSLKLKIAITNVTMDNNIIITPAPP